MDLPRGIVGWEDDKDPQNPRYEQLSATGLLVLTYQELSSFSEMVSSRYRQCRHFNQV